MKVEKWSYNLDQVVFVACDSQLDQLIECHVSLLWNIPKVKMSNPQYNEHRTDIVFWQWNLLGRALRPLTAKHGPEDWTEEAEDTQGADYGLFLGADDEGNIAGVMQGNCLKRRSCCRH